MKLTKAQHAMMVDLVVDCEPGTTVEFGAGEYEWRTAKSLEARGLLEITGQRSPVLGFFEAMATPAGRAVLAAKEGE